MMAVWGRDTCVIDLTITVNVIIHYDYAIIATIMGDSIITK